MPFDKVGLRGDIQTILMKFKTDLKIAPQTIDQNGDRATMDIFRRYWQGEEWRYVKYADLADGDFLPEDWILPINRQRLVNTLTPAFWADSPEVGASLGNMWQLANPNFPGYYIADQKIHILPDASVGSMRIYYVFRPTDLGDPNVADDVESSMPDNLRELIAATGALFTAQSYGARLEILQGLLQEVSNAVSSYEEFAKAYNIYQTREAIDD